MPHATVALTAQYLNVRQRKLGTIIIQTVRILHVQHESALEIHCLRGSLCMGIPTYFQMN